MRIAFTAPMKPPDHPVPSGDRTMARLLIAALERAGHTVEIASRLRTWQGDPDPAVLAANERRAAAEAEALIARLGAGGDAAGADTSSAGMAGSDAVGRDTTSGSGRRGDTSGGAPLGDRNSADPTGAGSAGSDTGGGDETGCLVRGVPELWLTYHLYHKAPDLIGPRVAPALGIPYVVVEASRAQKRASDGWARHFALADAALAAADAVCAVHRHDLAGLAGHVAPDRLHLLPPFIDTAPFAMARAARIGDTPTSTPPDSPDSPLGAPLKPSGSPSNAPPGTSANPSGAPPETCDSPTSAPFDRPGSPAGAPRLLAVGMMREGNKEGCYRLLADALARLGDRDWRLTVVGDGPRRAAIEPLFAPDRVTFLGEQPAAAMPAIYAAHDIFVWPAVNEPYGFVFLEAQAAGLPVIGASVRGVPDIVAAGETGLLPPPGDADAFAAALAALLDDPGRRDAMGRAAALYARTHHDIAAGSRNLDRILTAARAAHAKNARRKGASAGGARIREGAPSPPRARIRKGASSPPR